MESLSDKDGRIVVITDLFSSIGLATAILLSRSGHRVFGTVLDRSETPETPAFEQVELDVRDDESVERGVTDILEKAGRIDALVNNASICVIGGLEETSIGQSNELFQTNFFGALRMTYQVLPHMRLQGAGRILNVSSILGILPGPIMGVFTASQFALEGWSASLDQEVRTRGIRVSTIRTGLSREEGGARMRPPDRPLGRYRVQRARTSGRLRRAVGSSVDDEIVAEVLERALLDRSPKASYPAGTEAKLLSVIVRFAPSFLVEDILRRQLKLD